MTVQEAIKRIDETKCSSIFEAKNCLSNEKLLVEGLNLDQHRWYSVATNYYKLEDGILGITGVYQIFSEYMGSDDCRESVEAFEGEEYTTISYKPKQF